MAIIQLWKDGVISFNKKRRSGKPQNYQLFYVDPETGEDVLTPPTIVSVGNFSNKNILTENSFELSVSYDLINQCDIVTIEENGFTVVAFIMQAEYINNNNTRLYYKPDYFSTYRFNGILKTASGLCNRVTMGYTDENSYVNLLPEPISGNDITRQIPSLTTLFNTQISIFTGIDYYADNTPFLDSMGYNYIIFISSEFATWLNTVGNYMPTAFEINYSGLPLNPPYTPQIVNSFDSVFQSNTFYGGAISRGFPLIFTTFNRLKDFITTSLSARGSIFKQMPTQLFKDRSGTTLNANATGQYNELGNLSATTIDNNSTEIVVTKAITDSDIFSIKVIPRAFCNFLNTNKGDTSLLIKECTVQSPYDLTNFHGLKDELEPDPITGISDYSKSKIMRFPFWYFKFKTQAGNTIDLKPETLFTRDDIFGTDFRFKFQLKFTGGETPKLMIRFVPILNTDNWNTTSSSTEWITLIDYPSINWNISTQSQQNLQNLTNSLTRMANIERYNQGSATKGLGFMHGLKGGKSNTSQNIMQQTGTLLGNFLAPIARPILGNDINKELSSSQAGQNAGNVITNGGNVIKGDNDFDTLYSPPVSVGFAGFTNAECFSACRYLDNFGSAANVIINPLDNKGNIYGGRGFVSKNSRGETYYQFENLIIDDVIPVFAKIEISDLFMQGVYIIDD